MTLPWPLSRFAADGGIIAEGQTDENGESTLTIPAEELRLWSPENPFLYDAADHPGGRR